MILAKPDETCTFKYISHQENRVFFIEKSSFFSISIFSRKPRCDSLDKKRNQEEDKRCNQKVKTDARTPRARYSCLYRLSWDSNIKPSASHKTPDAYLRQLRKRIIEKNQSKEDHHKTEG